MSDVNKLMFSGRLTRDADLRYLDSGTAVADFSMCSNEKWKKDDETRERATFVDMTLWGKQAETLAQYLKKGKYLFVEGKLKLEKWELEDGTKRSKISVTVDKVTFAPRSNDVGEVDSEAGEAGEAGEAVGAAAGNKDTPF
jgi:single-strand DNA-binding protein